MQYQIMGADLTRNDLYYAKALASSLKLDIDTVRKAGTLTQSQAAMIADKAALLIDVSTKLNALSAAAQSLDAATFSAIGAMVGEINSGIDAIKTLVPIADASTVTLSAYRPGVPFTTAPAIYPGSALEPGKEIIAKLIAPIQATQIVANADGRTVDVTSIFATNKGRGGLDVAQLPGASSQKSGIPVGILAVAGLVAFLLANR